LDCTAPLNPCKGRLVSFRYDDDDDESWAISVGDLGHGALDLILRRKEVLAIQTRIAPVFPHCKPASLLHCIVWRWSQCGQLCRSHCGNFTSPREALCTVNCRGGGRCSGKC